MQWAQRKKAPAPLKGKLSDYLFAQLTGAYLAGNKQARIHQWQSLKAQGATVGVSDLLLAITTDQYAGLWIEMKRIKGGVVSEEQKQFIELMLESGYQAVIAHGAEDAIQKIEGYLNGRG